MFVPVEVVRASIVRHVEVGPAIVVIVPPNHSHAVVVTRIIHPRLLGNIFKGTVATIVEQEIRLPLHPPRPALHEHPAEAAELLVAPQLRQPVHVHLDVPGYEQIYISVTVIVAPGCAQAQTAHGQPSLVGHASNLQVPRLR